MAVNLTPWNGLDVEKLKVWVHRILPLVYDDSLSYYEVLAKVSAKMNEVIDGLNANNEQVEKVTNFTIEQVQNLTMAFNNFQESMLTRQNEFENKLLDEQHNFETQLDGDIAQWEEDTTEKFNQMYQDFLSAYQRQFGVVQITGQSETDVPSQKAWTNNAIVNNFSDIVDANECVGHNGYHAFINSDTEVNHIPISTGELINFNMGAIDVQLFWRTGVPTAYMWFRTHFSNNEIWSPWKQISTTDEAVKITNETGNSETNVPSQKAWTNNAIVYNFSETDANLCVGHNGIQQFVNSDTEVNHIPYNTGELINFNNGAIDMQLFWRTGSVVSYMWFRTYFRTHDRWSQWKQISTTDEAVKITNETGNSETNVPSQKAWTNNAIVYNFSETDANLCVGHNGIQQFVNSDTEVNHIPYNTGELINFNNGAIDMQLFWRTGSVVSYMWFRTYFRTHDRWSQWKQISTTDEAVNPDKEYDYDIVEWGDSITELGGDTTSYGHFLAKELGLKTVLNGGGSGDRSWDIAFRAGANPIIQKKGAVNGEYNYSDTKDIYGHSIQLLTNSKFELSTVNPLEINGQTVTFDGTVKENTFTLSGYQGMLEYDVPIGTAGRTHKGKITTIFTGTNNSNDHDAIIKYNNQIISLVPNNNYIVLGIYAHDVSNLTELDTKMIAEYGVHFFDTRKELRENGLAIVGLTPTEQDISDAEEGKISQQLLADGLHLNENGRKALGKLLALFIKARGFINY